MNEVSNKPVHAWFSVSRKTHFRVFFDSFFSVRVVAKRYMYPTAKVFNEHIGTCQLETRWYNF